MSKTSRGERSVICRRTRWLACSSPRISGRRFPPCCLRSVGRGVRHEMTAGSLRPCCGGDAQVCHCATFLLSSERGRRCSIASTAGLNQVDGVECSPRCRQTVMTSGIAWTALSTVPTNTRRAQKGGECARDRSVTRRVVDKGALGSRCSRAATRFRDHRGPTP
jgi:hypothetical protein